MLVTNGQTPAIISSSSSSCSRSSFAVLLAVAVASLSFPQQVHATDARSGADCGCQFEHPCFPTNGVLLKEAVDAYYENPDAWNSTNGLLHGVTYGPIEELCTGDVTTLNELFQYKSNFDADISRWNTAQVISLYRTFMGANSFSGDISGWSVSLVTTMREAFVGASLFDGRGLEAWDVSKVDSMYNTFTGATSFNGDISGWQVSQVSNMNGMFHGATSFNVNVAGWDVSQVFDMEWMFYGASSFNQDLCTWKNKGFPQGKQTTEIFINSNCTFPYAFCASDTDCTIPSPTKSPTSHPTETPSANPTPAIPSWHLEYISFDADFNKDDEGEDDSNEIIVLYKIGKRRDTNVALFREGCEVALTSEDGVEVVDEFTSEIDGDHANENFHVGLNVIKNATVLSNIYYVKAGDDEKTLNLCIQVELIDSNGAQVKENKTDISVEFNFENNFTIAPIKLNQVNVGSDETTSNVEGYVQVCTCENKEGYNCNENSLGKDDYLNVCIQSTSPDMEIHYLDSIEMSQAETGEKLVIVEDAVLKSDEISSMTLAPSWNGVHVATVVPSRFFSYEKESTATVSGVVFLKLAGSSSTRRRVAVEILANTETGAGTRLPSGAGASGARALQQEGQDVVDEESAFTIDVKLKKDEPGLVDGDNVNTNANGTVANLLSRFIAIATVIGSAVAIIIW